MNQIPDVPQAALGGSYMRKTDHELSLIRSDMLLLSKDINGARQDIQKVVERIDALSVTLAERRLSDLQWLLQLVGTAIIVLLLGLILRH